jgi:hypothetical protein
MLSRALTTNGSAMTPSWQARRVTDPGTGQRAPKPGPPLSVSLLIVVLGIVLAVAGGTEGISKIVRAVTSPVLVTPADIHRHLGSGTYEIYVSDDVIAPINPADITVTSAGGLRIPINVVGSSSTQTLTRDGRSYNGEVTFTVSNPGDYEVLVGGRSGVPFILSNSLGDIVRHAVLWLALLGFGVLIAVLGGVLVIIGSVRRHRARNPRQAAVYQPVSGPPPPGWYADPSVPGLSRWWDGTRWTDQTHPQ